MSRDRLLVIDADLPRRLATWLVIRQRDAVSAAELGLADSVKDPELLRGLAERYNGQREWVLVTGDDAMPAEYGDIIRETAATVATIHPDYPADEVTEYAWRIDVVHRWAHAIQDQAPQTVRRYSLTGSQLWRPRRRHRRQIAEHGWVPWRGRPETSDLAPEPPAPETRSVQDHLPGLE